MESNYLNLPKYDRMKRRRQGKGNFLYVRDADDVVVLSNGTKTEAQTMKEALRRVLDTMGVRLLEEKTKITHITEGFTFLGYKIIRRMGRRGKMAPKVLIPASAIKRFQHTIRETLAPNTTRESTSAKLQAQNRITRGWCQYYCKTSSPSEVFGKLQDELYWDMAHWLGRKYKINTPAVMQKYKEGNTFRTTTVKLVMPTEYKAVWPKLKTWHNPYTGNGKIEREAMFSYDNLWTGYEERHGWNDLREEAIQLKGTTCHMCGRACHPSEGEIDHVTPRAKFKDPTEADCMENLQILCTPCHRAKTKTDLKVLSRMR